MPRSIMEVMQENVSPVSVSNALYELMVDWRALALQTTLVCSHSKERSLRSKRAYLETILGRFFLVSDDEMQKLLEQHFDIQIPKRVRS